MSIWDSVKGAAKQVGDAAGVAAERGKLNAEILLTDRGIENRKRAFGVELYDYVHPLTKNTSFYTSDDTLTSTLQPPLITAQREISNLENKRNQTKEKINQTEVKRKGAFPVPAANWQQKLVNAGKSTAFASSEAKLKTDLAATERIIKGHKEDFGIELYDKLEFLEDARGWVPTNREIRSLYDSCRKDIEGLKEKRDEKRKRLVTLGGTDPGPIKKEKGFSTGSAPTDIIDESPASSTKSYGATSDPLAYKAPAPAPAPVAPPPATAGPFGASSPSRAPSLPRPLSPEDPFVGSSLPAAAAPAPLSHPSTTVTASAPMNYPPTLASAPAPAVPDDPFAIFSTPATAAAPVSQPAMFAPAPAAANHIPPPSWVQQQQQTKKDDAFDWLS